MAREQTEYGQRLLPTLIDEIAATTPERVYASVPNEDSDLSKGFKDITYAEFAHAIDGVAWWLDETLGKADGTFPTFAYFGPRDLGYAVVIVAAAKVGRKVLLPSHLASQDAHLFLLNTLTCTAVVYASDLAPLAQSLRTHYPSASYICTPSLCTWLTNPDPVPQAQRYMYNKPYNTAHLDPVMIVHTSGTTGIPKPVIWTHDMLACVDRLHNLPGPTNAAKSLHGQSIYSALPVFHTAGITGALLTPVYLGTTVILGPSGILPDVPTVLAILSNTHVSTASMPPSLLEALLSTPKSLNALRSLEKIVYGGAPVSAHASRILAKELPHTVTSALGSTEGGLWLTAPAPTPQDRDYHIFHPYMSAEFRHVDAELYELVIRRSPESCTFTNFFRALDATPTYPRAQSGVRDGDGETVMEFATKDLFSPHPDEQKEGLWRYRCRKDDLILLSGEVKMYAGAVEEAISAHADIAAVVVGGQQRSRPFMLVQAVRPVHSEVEKEEFLDSIWDTVEEENGKYFETARVRRELCLVVAEVKRTPKGGVDRLGTIARFEGEIERVYKSLNGV